MLPYALSPTVNWSIGRSSHAGPTAYLYPLLALHVVPRYTHTAVEREGRQNRLFRTSIKRTEPDTEGLLQLLLKISTRRLSQADACVENRML